MTKRKHQQECFGELFQQECFTQFFRRIYGREFTEADLRQILEEQYGIKPDAKGYYYRSQFEPLWKQLEKPQ
jgi:hypothetical protein